MKKLLCLVYVLCITLCVCSQDSTRGLSIITTAKEAGGTTRALLVGVSDYQNLPRLQYADKDAIEFAYFLTHNQSWHVAPENIKLLTNDKARAGDIITWLNWLLENSKAGDNIVFYFSGHGDVETSNDAGKGYLLTYDSPKNNYITGAISIDMLRQVYTEMIDKGIKLYMITDACRAGHLAGGSSGTKTTAESFSKQWRNEVKILSAQPDELSYEGNQWGGGRGVFSFFLTKGLSGYADINKDSSITLAEIEQYVGLQVSQETGFKQQPVFEGASKYSNKVAKWDADGMSRYEQYKSGDIAVLVVKEKGSDYFDAGDCTALYEQLKKEINVIEDSAGIYTALSSYKALEKCNNAVVRDNARFGLTAALLNYVQQVVNQTLIGKRLIGPPQFEEGLKVIDIINTINEGKRLVNRSHLENIRRYFIINNTSFWDDDLTTEKQDELKLMLDSSLAQEPGAAYLELMRGILFMNTEEYDSALINFKQAIQHSPTWLMAYYYVAQALNKKDKYKEAVQYLEKVLTLDTAFQTFECAKCFYNELGSDYVLLKQYENAEKYLLKAAADGSFISPLTTLVQLYHYRKQYDKRNKLLERLKTNLVSINDKLLYLQMELELGIVNKKLSAVWLDSLENIVPDEDEALFYYVWAQWHEYFKLDPLRCFRMAHDVEPENFLYTQALIEALTSRGEFEEAAETIKSVEVRLKRSDRAELDINLAACYTYTNREKEGFALYRHLIAEGWLTCKDIKQLKPLRKLPEFLAYIKSCKQ